MARTTGSTAAETRQRVLRAALELCATRGYAGTSLRDIAERLSMTKAAIYYHFPSKEDLLLALVAPLFDELAACVREASTTTVAPRRLIRRVVDAFDDNRSIVRGILYDPTVRRVLLEQHEMSADLIAIERLLARSDDPADLLRARCAFGAIRGAVISVVDVDSLALGRPPDGVDLEPRLSEVDRETVTAAAMAVLRSGRP
jgi:AcrR family transcriptional regulator